MWKNILRNQPHYDHRISNVAIKSTFHLHIFWGLHLYNIYRHMMDADDHGVIFGCDQAALRSFISVCLSVCLSVGPSVTPVWQCSCNRIILVFSGVITIDRHDARAKGQGQRWKVKVTEIMTLLSHFWTVTQVWIHIWWWNKAHSLMLLRRGVLLFLKVLRQISRSQG